MKTPQEYFQFLNHTEYLYDETYKSILLKTIGGSTDSTPIITGNHVINNILTYENAGEYEVFAVKKGDSTYLDISDSIVIKISKDFQPELYLNMPDSFSYEPNVKRRIDISGGSSNGGKIRISGKDVLESMDDGHYYLNNNSVGKHSVTAYKDGSFNYYDISDNFTITIVTSDLRSFFSDVSLENSYTPYFHNFDNTIVLTESEDYIYTTDSNYVDISGNVIRYFKPDISFTIHAHFITNNYNTYSNNDSVTFLVKPKTSVESLFIKGFPVNVIKKDENYTIYEIADVYPLLSLIDGGFTVSELKLVGFDACELYATREFTVNQLQDAGYRFKFCLKN